MTFPGIVRRPLRKARVSRSGLPADTNRRGRMELTTWTCSGCQQTIDCVAVAVGHRCPSRRFVLTDWTPIDPFTTSKQESRNR
jgi:hypothetical protein